MPRHGTTVAWRWNERDESENKHIGTLPPETLALCSLLIAWLIILHHHHHHRHHYDGFRGTYFRFGVIKERCRRWSRSWRRCTFDLIAYLCPSLRDQVESIVEIKRSLNAAIQDHIFRRNWIAKRVDDSAGSNSENSSGLTTREQHIYIYTHTSLFGMLAANTGPSKKRVCECHYVMSPRHGLGISSSSPVCCS